MYLFASSLTAAALDGLFEHPARTFDPLRDIQQSYISSVSKQFFNSLLSKQERIILCFFRILLPQA
jgi:hypothetical protein